ncbi:MAG: hypothetical protein MJE12_03340 [Alphaproteobacteria bacterium]|nr:hypothetical protein [Alphaproteobacteria bacterium]
MPLDAPKTGQIVFDPRGIVETTPIPLGKRVTDLNGLRLGVLSNKKWNGNKLLRKTQAILEDEFDFADVRFYEKESFSKNADPGLLGDIISENDIVLTAIGD